MDQVSACPAVTPDTLKRIVCCEVPLNHGVHICNSAASFGGEVMGIIIVDLFARRLEFSPASLSRVTLWR